MTVPSKPAFDPEKHLIKNKKEKKSRRRQRDTGEDRPPSSRRERRPTKSPPRSPTTLPEGSGADEGDVQRRKATEDDDAAIARALQEQLLEEEHNRNRQHKETHQEQRQLRQQYGDQQPVFDSRSQDQNRNQMQDDMQLMLMMQRQEMEAAVSAGRMGGAPATQGGVTPSVDDMELARRMQQAEISETVQSGYQNQLDYARRIQQQAFADAHRRSKSYGDPPAQRRSSSGDAPSDAELARRMQELEQLGMGRLNSNKRINQDPGEVSSDGRSRQEEEDARLARMMAESGGSFRGMQHPGHSRDSSNVSVPPPPPPRNSVNAPPPSPGRPSSARNKGRSRTPPSRAPAAMQPVSVGNGGNGPDPFGRDLGRRQHGSESAPPKEKKKRGFFSRKDKSKDTRPTSSSRSPSPAIPAPIPPPPGRSREGPVPYSTVGSENLNVPIAPNAQHQRKKGLGLAARNKPSAMCSACQRPASSFLVALDKKYHAECFKCVGCHLVIDSSGPFAYMADEQGDKHPLHRKCYAELYGVKCAVCKQSIPAGPDGKVSFVKHPFFDTEQMCPKHASNPGRRCTGCHRFEPEGEPFADLNDSGRCACFSCCRSVIVDSSDAEPLWKNVVSFFENHLKLPIWKDMRKVPILVVGYDALNDQLMASGGAHGGSSQIMTRGLCLTEHQSGRRFKLSKVRYNSSSQRFEACDVEEKGFTFFQVPDASKVNPDASVTAILCLSGLPRDLAASVLAHEALHAWIKLHPRFDISFPIPPQVEEGCAQLIAMLYLTEGLEAASTETYGDSGPSDEKLRQYFKFSIETDDHDIYGEGYRRAAQAYANIGIEALLGHVVRYRAFPTT